MVANDAYDFALYLASIADCVLLRNVLGLDSLRKCLSQRASLGYFNLVTDRFFFGLVVAKLLPCLVASLSVLFLMV